MATKKTVTVVNPQEELIAKRNEYIETKRSHAAGELVNPRALPRIRKEIARLMTQINTPVVAEAAAETKEEEKK